MQWLQGSVHASDRPSVRQPRPPSVYLLVRPFVRLSMRPPVCVSVRLFRSPSVHPCVRLSITTFACPSDRPDACTHQAFLARGVCLSAARSPQPAPMAMFGETQAWGLEDCIGQEDDWMERVPMEFLPPEQLVFDNSSTTESPAKSSSSSACSASGEADGGTSTSSSSPLGVILPLSQSSFLRSFHSLITP